MSVRWQSAAGSRLGDVVVDGPGESDERMMDEVELCDREWVGKNEWDVDDADDSNTALWGPGCRKADRKGKTFATPLGEADRSA